MVKVGCVTLAARDRDDLFEVQDLRRADDQPNRVRFQILDSIIHRREIGGRIIETPIAFANDGWPFRQLGNVGEKNANRAFADLGDFRFKQAFHHRGEAVVVEAFASLNVVMNIQNPIRPFEFL